MAATLRELRGRIRSAGSIKKITKAQELIATSRIAKAQARVEAARPYSAEITNMLTDLAAESALDHPLLVERANPKRAAVLVVSAHADPPMIWACIVQETAQALGMFGRDDALAWTAFNTQLQHVDLTGQDLAFLRLLYRPALQPGMPREAVAAAICGAVRGCA